jgi:hypothetical protein
MEKFFSILLEYLKVLTWPSIVLFCLIMFRNQLYKVIERLEKASLPGASFEFSKDAQEAKKLAQEVKVLPQPEKAQNVPLIPLTEVNKRLVSLDLEPSPSGLDMSYYRELLNSNPILALAILKTDLEIQAKNLAKGWEINIDSKDSGFELLRKLYDKGAISKDQFDLLRKIYTLCDRAISSQSVAKYDAETILDAADVLVAQYIAWLSWGFDDEWAYKKEIPVDKKKVDIGGKNG